MIFESLPKLRTRILAPIPVLAIVRSPSDLIMKLIDREDFKFRAGEKRRALRLGQALVMDARDRGYKVSALPEPKKDRCLCTVMLSEF